MIERRDAHNRMNIGSAGMRPGRMNVGSAGMRPSRMNVGSAGMRPSRMNVGSADTRQVQLSPRKKKDRIFRPDTPNNLRLPDLYTPGKL